MTIRSLHFALTPLAGSPARIVSALNRHTDVQARFVCLNPDAYGRRRFAGDLDWRSDREEAFDLIRRADVVVLHHYFPLSENPFGIDFGSALTTKARVVRQFHTMPNTIATQYGFDLNTILTDPLPQLVVAQFHERYYPRARPVPLLVPLWDPEYLPAEKPDGEVTIFFAPTFRTGAWASRWDTKGLSETNAILRRIRRADPRVRLEVLTNRAHSECLARRRRSHLAIDEVVTGSFHTSSLESLAQGIPTFAFLDARTVEIVHSISGSLHLPWLNFRLEDCEAPLRALVQDSELRCAIGVYSRTWMERHWDERNLVQHYRQAFADVLDDPGSFARPRFDPDDRRTRWFLRDQHDLCWEARKRRQTRGLKSVGNALAQLRNHSTWARQRLAGAGR